jgi:hypothetical protein
LRAKYRIQFFANRLGAQLLQPGFFHVAGEEIADALLIGARLQVRPRRDFIKQAAIASAGIVGLPASGFSLSLSPLNLPGKLSVVFQGDSITDYGRDKSSTKANETDKMGAG